MPDDTKNSWWRKFISKIDAWLTPINIVAFGATFIGTILEFFLTMKEANNPRWYGISKEHADEIMSCLNKYMFKAGWGEAVSTLFLDSWWSWEIVSWACAIGLPILVTTIAFEKYNAYERAWNAIYEREKKEKIHQLESYAEQNLIRELTENLSIYEVEMAQLAQQQVSTIIRNLEISPQNTIEKIFQDWFYRIKQYKDQAPQDLQEIIDRWIEQEEKSITGYEIDNEIQNKISAKTVWRNSYKEILLTITSKNRLNFSFLFFTLYQWFIENHYAKKFRYIIPVILHQLEHDPKYEDFDKDCLKVISSAIATDTIYNIKTLLVILLIPCVATLGIGVCVALPKFVRWPCEISDVEENKKLIEETAGIEHETIEIQDTKEFIKPLQPPILNPTQVLI
ncbi:MAG: hypothetical protein AMJ43_05240 [Coxiella sp. DG_40]|nr:MAG: hypothetical protein AMJ43_05240 [Coxiella sp. DG_40]